MYGVSKISSEQNIMLTTFPGAQYSAQSLAEHLDVFAKAGIVVDMICQSAPRGSAVDFGFTTSYDNFAAVMKALPAAAKANPPLVSGGYSKINLFGEEMVTSCGVAARALHLVAACETAGEPVGLKRFEPRGIEMAVDARQREHRALAARLHEAYAAAAVANDTVGIGIHLEGAQAARRQLAFDESRERALPHRREQLILGA